MEEIERPLKDQLGKRCIGETGSYSVVRADKVIKSKNEIVNHT